MRVSDTHWAILAGTRFYLASVVMNAHCGLAIPPYPPYPPVYMFGRELGPLAAILGFLAISGFSIGHSYRRPQGFYGRRVGRIFPSLLVAVVLFASVLAVWGPISTTQGTVAYPARTVDILCTLVGLNGFLVGSFLGPTWSLSAELSYYWCTPALNRLNNQSLLVLMAFSALIYWLNANFGIGAFPGVLYGLAAISLFWAWGCGFIYSRTPQPWVALLLAASGVILLNRLNYEGGTYSEVTFLVAAAAIAAGRYAQLPSSVRSILNYLGDLSYPLYLIHYPIIITLNGVLGVRSQPLLVAASLFASTVCLHMVERPLRPLISRLLSHQALLRRATALVPR
jgi:peptidoglycan/LPS O-acetylase OafA/YrhL